MPRAAVRIGQYVLVVWVALTLNFLVPHLAPGDAIDYFGGQTNSLSPQGRAVLQRQYGTEGSPMAQYARYWQRLAHGDLGTSTRYGVPVTELLRERVPWTLLLVGTGVVLSLVAGTLAGAAAGWRRGQKRDVALVTGVLLAQAMPPFWIGMVLVAVLAVHLGWLPSFGATPLGSSASGLGAFVGVARHLVLPATTIALATVGSTFLLVRGAMIATLSTPYVLMAEAKGASSWRIAFRHALRNALLPVYTHLTLSLGALVSGAVVVETVFAYPGMGRLVYDAILARDYAVLQGCFLLMTLAVVAMNLVADLTYPLLDPRVRRAGTSDLR